jgi:GNAT superfamily N-acetyltransferase
MEAPAITIRQALAADAGIIRDFQKAMAMETEGLTLNHDILTRGVEAVFIDRTRGRYFVAESGDTIIASLLITYEWSDWRNSNVWWFQSVYVIPEFRRKGVFTMMYDYIRGEAIREGVAGLRLYVETTNRRAHKTYKAMGMNGSHYKMYEWLRD